VRLGIAALVQNKIPHAVEGCPQNLTLTAVFDFALAFIDFDDRKFIALP
jgi:hypothetical protein